MLKQTTLIRTMESGACRGGKEITLFTKKIQQSVGSVSLDLILIDLNKSLFICHLISIIFLNIL
jgi:hypothetical protein